MSQRRLSLNIVSNTDGVIADKVDLLFEKRKAVRQSALSALNTALSLRYCGDALESRQETLAEGLEKVLKDQQLEPTLLALRTANLASISIRSGHLPFYTKLRETLHKIIANKSMPTSIRSEALNSLATLCFMSNFFNGDDHDVTSTTDTLNLLFNTMFAQPGVSHDITRAALQSCIFLGSALPSDIQRELFSRQFFSKVAAFMGEEHDILLRVAAAKAVTVLIEWKKDYLEEEDDQSEVEEEIGEILDKVHAILEDKTKFKSAEEKKKQRTTLKDIIAYLEEDEVKQETLVIRSNALILDTWTQIFRMDRFRGCLGEGFTSHLEGNGNLMDLFEYFVDATVPIVPTMTKQQRRVSLSGVSKDNTKARSVLRAIRESEVGYATD